MNFQSIEKAKALLGLVDKNICSLCSRELTREIENLIRSVGGKGKMLKKGHKKINYYVWPSFTQAECFIETEKESQDPYQLEPNRQHFFNTAENISIFRFEKVISMIKKDILDIFHNEYETNLTKKNAKEITKSYPFLINFLPQNIKEYCVSQNQDLLKYLISSSSHESIKKNLILKDGRNFDYLHKHEKKYLHYIEAAIFSKKNNKLNLIKKLKNIQINVLDFSLMQNSQIFELIWQQYKKKLERENSDPFIMATHKKRLINLSTLVR